MSVERYIGFDEAAVLNEIDQYTSYIRENPRHPIYVLAADYDALEAERDAIRSDFDALGAHYREALAERDKLQVQVNEFKGGACPLSFLEQTQYDRDQWKARAEAAEKLAIGSIRFMEEDFPEAPEELDRACVSGPYLDHYKALLALRDRSGGSSEALLSEVKP